MNASELWVVIPVKDLVNAKQRLSGVISPSERRALSQAMAEDMLDCLRRVDNLAGILIVSDDPGAELLAYCYGARVLKEEGHSRGLNAAVEQAATFLAAEGASHMLVLHGDLPAIEAGDIARLVADLPQKPFVRLVPDSRGEGSNALLCSLPTPLSFCYGENSFTVHRESCKKLGLSCEVVELQSLQLDIDTPRDLVALLDLLDADLACKTKTRAVLSEYQLATRLRQMRINNSDTFELVTTGVGGETGVDHVN